MQTKTVNALKDLYVSYGGTNADVQNINNIPDVINAISTLDISSGSDDDTETVNALKDLYVANGGTNTDVQSISKVSDMINAIATINSLSNIDVMGEDAETELFGAKVKTYQMLCIVYPLNILGYWTEVEGGLSPSGPLSGTGYFVALRFVNNCDADKIEVGVDPSESGMGLVELDSDMNAVFKISDLSTQQIIVKVTKDGFSNTMKYKMSVMAL